METKKEITQIEIITSYMDHVLSLGKTPDTIYQFSKEIEMNESDFYKFFSSFEHLETEIFTVFFNNTISLLENKSEFHEFTAKDKLLSFYFTFFENLTANRSYVLFALEKQHNKLKVLKKLTGLKTSFSKFVNTLDIEKIDLKQERLQSIQNKGFEEAFWIQLLIILKFWINDTSPSFEKTDLFIEKSLHASFDMINTQPVKSFIDLGKFILKEKLDFKL